MFKKCFRNVLVMFKKCLRNVLEMFQKIFQTSNFLLGTWCYIFTWPGSTLALLRHFLHSMQFWFLCNFRVAWSDHNTTGVDEFFEIKILFFLKQSWRDGHVLAPWRHLQIEHPDVGSRCRPILQSFLHFERLGHKSRP